MGRFESQNGLVQFVFANEDAYYLDSLLRLNLKDYLCHELYRQGYARVIFVEGIAPDIAVRVFDRDSWQYVCEQSKSAFGGLFSAEKPYEASAGGFVMNLSEERLLRLLKNPQECAFVFHTDNFARLFRGKNYQLENLIRQNPHRKNLFLIEAPVTSDTTTALLAAQDRIFQASADGGPLFPELKSAFADDSVVDESCYIRLKKLMGDRCVFLNDFSVQNIENVIFWVFWMRRSDGRLYSSEEIRNAARFIQAWYRSPKLRSRYPMALSDNEKRYFYILAGDIENRWASIREYTAAWIEEGCPDQKLPELYVLSENPFVSQLKAIRFPDQYQKQQASCVEDWRQLVREYGKPRNRRPDQEVKGPVTHAIERMGKAVEQNDQETFQRTRACLMFALEKGFVYDKADAHTWECYEKIGELSGTCFALRSQIRADEQNIRRWKKEEEELEYRINNGMIRDDFERRHAMNEAMLLNDRVDKRERIAVKNTEAYNAFRNSIQNLENFLKATWVSDDRTIKDTLQRSADMLEHYQQQTKSETVQMEESSADLEKLLDRITGTSLEKEYEKSVNMRKASHERERAFQESVAPVLEEAKEAWMDESASAAAAEELYTDIKESEASEPVPDAAGAEDTEQEALAPEDGAVPDFSEEIPLQEDLFREDLFAEEALPETNKKEERIPLPEDVRDLTDIIF